MNNEIKTNMIIYYMLEIVQNAFHGWIHFRSIYWVAAMGLALF